MQLYPADYLADTMHLNAEEHGAYLLLLMNYWQTGKPIPKHRLQGIARVPNDRWTTVERALNEYFVDDGETWLHRRIEADICAAKDAQVQRERAGKASAEARKSAKREQAKSLKSKGSSNDRSTTVERPLNDRSTNRDTDTDTDKKKSTKAVSTASVPYQEIVDAYHSRLPMLPAVRKLNETRKRKLRARWHEDATHQSVEYWDGFFAYAARSDFLTGRNGQWTGCDFEWLMGDSNHLKVTEGKYENKEAA